jgi:hypothetical protein
MVVTRLDGRTARDRPSRTPVFPRNGVVGFNGNLVFLEQAKRQARQPLRVADGWIYFIWLDVCHRRGVRHRYSRRPFVRTLSRIALDGSGVTPASASAERGRRTSSLVFVCLGRGVLRGSRPFGVTRSPGPWAGGGRAAKSTPTASPSGRLNDLSALTIIVPPRTRQVKLWSPISSVA